MWNFCRVLRVYLTDVEKARRVLICAMLKRGQRATKLMLMPNLFRSALQSCETEFSARTT